MGEIGPILRNQIIMHKMNDKMKKIFIFLACLLGGLNIAGAQAGLIIQGAIQNSSGAPMPNGNYSLSFRLYEADAGGVAVWSETQPSVPVTSGLYTVSLGAVTPLTAPFDKIYYLGVSVNGGNELIPRARLSSSPYAMSLFGETNLFPSAGSVGIGTVTPDAGTQLHVAQEPGVGRVLIEGDNGSALRFKQGSNSADISYDGDKITVSNMNLTLTDDLNLQGSASVNYTGLKNWRLIDTDNFETGDDGWTCVDDWVNNTPRTFDRFSPNTPFSQGYILRPNQFANDALKKKFDLTGIPHTRIKVVFTYHFFDSCDGEVADNGVAGFASQLNPYTSLGQSNGYFQIGWLEVQPVEFNFGGAGYTNFYPNVDAADSNVRREMIAQHTGNDFWLLFTSSMQEPANDESFGISNIEIWVQ